MRSSITFTLGQISLNPRGVLNQFQGAARDFGLHEAGTPQRKTSRQCRGAGLAVSIPDKRFRGVYRQRLCAWARGVRPLIRTIFSNLR